MKRITCMLLYLLSIFGLNQAQAITNIPEPSIVLYGTIQVPIPDSSPQKFVTVARDGLKVSARLNNIEIASSVLDSVQVSGGVEEYLYWLEIPVEANIGNSSGDAARLANIVYIYIDGQKVPGADGALTITDKGKVIRRNLTTDQPIDSDGDGIPDSRDSDPYNANIPLPFGGSADIDGDGRSNALEFIGDKDDDEYDPDGDFDEDGFSNTDEYERNVDPANKASYPINHVELGQYTPIVLGTSINSLIMSRSEDAFTWDATWGVYRGAMFVHWSLNGTPDLLLSSEQGFYLVELDESHRVIEGSHELLEFPGLPIEKYTELKMGYADFVGDGIYEIWFHLPDNSVYIYKREAKENPFGNQFPWTVIANVPYGAATEVYDANSDNVADIVYSSQLDASENTTSKTLFTLRIKEGISENDSDGNDQYTTLREKRFTNFEFEKPAKDLLAINNLEEIGFDTHKDLWVSGFNNFPALSKTGWDTLILPSAHMYSGILMENVASQQSDSTPIAVNNTVQAFDEYASVSDNSLLAIDINGDKLMDQLRFEIDPSGNNEGRFIIHYGTANNKDSDEDGIVDFKDPYPKSKNKPWPVGADSSSSGSGDFDNDGLSDAFEIRYGFDPKIAQSDTLDSDKDGFTDQQEYFNNTNPRISDNPNGRLLTLVRERTLFGLDDNNNPRDISAVVVKDQMLIAASHHSTRIEILNVNELSKTLRSINLNDPENGLNENNGVNALLLSGDYLYIAMMSDKVYEVDLNNSDRPKLIMDGSANSSILSLSMHLNTLYASDSSGNVLSVNLHVSDKINNVTEINFGTAPISHFVATDDYFVAQMTGTHKEITVKNRADNSLYYSVSGILDNSRLAASASNGESLGLAQHFNSDHIYIMNIEDSTSRIVADKQNSDIVRTMVMNKNLLYVGYQNGTVQRINIQDVDEIVSVNTTNHSVTSMSQQGDYLVTGHANGRLFVWRVSNEN